MTTPPDANNLLNCSVIGSQNCTVEVFNGIDTNTIKKSISGLSNGFVWNLVKHNLQYIGLNDDLLNFSSSFEFFCCGTYTEADVQNELYKRWYNSGGMSGPSVSYKGVSYNTFGRYFDFFSSLGSDVVPNYNSNQTPFFQILNPYFYYITYQLFENINGFNKVNNQSSLKKGQKQVLDNLLTVLNNPFGVGSLLIKKYCDNTFFNNSDYINSIGKNNKAFNIRSALSNTYLGQWCGSGLSVGDFLIKDGACPAVGKGVNIRTHCEPFANYDNGLKTYGNYNYYVNNDTPFNPNRLQTTNGFFEAKKCEDQQICVINNVVTNTANDEGTINFNQYCRGCKEKEENCLCYIINPSTLSKMSGMGSPVVFSQNCSGGQCYLLTPTKDNGTSMKAVSCGNQPGNSGKLPPSTVNGSGITDVNESRVVGDSYEYGITLWNIPIYFLVFGIIFLLLLEIMDRSVKKIFKKVGITNKEVHINDMSKLQDKEADKHAKLVTKDLSTIDSSDPTITDLSNIKLPDLDNLNI